MRPASDLPWCVIGAGPSGLAALKNLRANPRVKSIRVTVANDACPHCYELLKTYAKGEVPPLPHLGCSHENGCRCFYEPVLEETAIVGKVVK